MSIDFLKQTTSELKHYSPTPPPKKPPKQIRYFAHIKINNLNILNLVTHVPVLYFQHPLTQL